MTKPEGVDGSRASAMSCDACGEVMVVACLRVTGFPDMHVQGSRVTYCPLCGPVPTITLDTEKSGGCVLVSDPVQ